MELPHTFTISQRNLHWPFSPLFTFTQMGGRFAQSSRGIGVQSLGQGHFSMSGKLKYGGFKCSVFVNKTS